MSVKIKNGDERAAEKGKADSQIRREYPLSERDEVGLAAERLQKLHELHRKGTRDGKQKEDKG